LREFFVGVRKLRSAIGFAGDFLRAFENVCPDFIDFAVFAAAGNEAFGMRAEFSGQVFFGLRQVTGGYILAFRLILLRQ